MVVVEKKGKKCGKVWCHVSHDPRISIFFHFVLDLNVFFLIRIELLAIGVVILFSTFFLFNPKKNLYINFWITESMNFVGVCVCMWLICPFWLRIKKRKKINKKTRIATRNKNKDLFIFEMIAWMLVVGPGSWDRKIFHFFPFTARIYYLQNQIQNKKKHWERQISKKKENIVYKHSTNSCFISFQIIIDLINCEQFFMTLNWLLLLLLLHFYSSSWWWCFRFLYILFGHFDWAEFGTRKKFFSVTNPNNIQRFEILFSGFFFVLENWFLIFNVQNVFVCDHISQIIMMMIIFLGWWWRIELKSFSIWSSN